MDEQKEQKELFEFEEPKRQFSGIRGIFHKAGFENRLAVTLELDRLIFIAIGLLLFLVVVYALGVEAGRAGARRRLAVISVPKTTERAAAVQSPSMGPAVKPAIEAPVAPQLPYTIAAGAFKNRDSAVAQAGRLKRGGLEATVVSSGAYHVVCVGAFQDTQSPESRAALAKVKKSVPGAYFKSR